MIRDIPGYEGIYACADYNAMGKIWSYKLKKWIGYEDKTGHIRVQLTRKSQKTHVHRLVWETFNGKIKEGYEIHHVDGNKKNNALKNLVCITKAEHTIIHMTGRKIEEATRKKISESHMGIKHTEETKKRISEIQRPKYKAVVQLDKETGNFIAEYESTHEAKRQTGVPSGNIVNACKGRAKTAGGYCWMYAEDYYKEE